MKTGTTADAFPTASGVKATVPSEATAGIVVSCPAPLGSGGLGQHLAQLVGAYRASDELACYFATDAGDRVDPAARIVCRSRLATLLAYTPLRSDRAVQSWVGAAMFDRSVARRLKPAKVLLCFAGSARSSFARARRLRYEELHLESGGTHVAHARRMYDFARHRHPIEPDWLHPALVRRILREYVAADVIWVNSEYARQTFVDEGVPTHKLRRRTLVVDARFTPGPPPDTRPSGLHVVYVGSLSVTKGTPDLLDAFAAVHDPLARLTLVGGHGTRPMRKFIEVACRRDPRIVLAPGDPLPHLRSADLFVFPSYADGLGLAPLEAMRAGVPVIVTETTGMKEYVRDERDGFVVPVGRTDVIADLLVRFASGEFDRARAVRAGAVAL